MGRLRFESSAKFVNDLLLARLSAMGFETKPLQPKLLEAVIDDVQCGHLCAHEEHFLVSSECISDKICDRLALSCARRPVHNHVVAQRRQCERLKLARVCRQYRD